MTRGRGLILGAALAVASLTATASAQQLAGESVRLSGSAIGDNDSVVRLSVGFDREGTAKTVTRFRFKKVLAECEGFDDLQRISVKLTGRAPIDEDRLYERRFGGSSAGLVEVSGRVSRTGTRTVGVMNARNIPVEGIGTCDVGDTGYRAK